MDVADGLIAQVSLLAFGLVVGAVVHEGGHALFGRLVGTRTRVVNIGVGRPLLRVRWRGTWLILRICPLAAGWMVPEFEERRWARAVLVAGGPSSNLICLGALYAATLFAPSIYDLLEPIGFVQLFAVAATLCPYHQKVEGRSAPSDGLRLWRIVVGRERVDLAASYARLLRSVQPAEAPPHAPSRYAGEILYHAQRWDRWREAWARRDIAERAGDLLGAPDLTPAERALLLALKLHIELVFDEGTISPDLLDRWSREVVALAPTPSTLSLRGAVLVAQGDHDAGHAMLDDAIAGFDKRRELPRIDSAFAHAFMGCATARQRDHVAEAGFDEYADEYGDFARRWFAMARKIAGRSQPIAAPAIDQLERAALRDPPRTRLALVKAWLAGRSP